MKSINAAALEIACGDLAIAEKRLEVALKGITDFLYGNYINPREFRPLQCDHGTYYYEDCNSCDCEHFEKVLEEVRHAGVGQQTIKKEVALDDQLPLPL